MLSDCFQFLCKLSLGVVINCGLIQKVYGKKKLRALSLKTFYHTGTSKHSDDDDVTTILFKFVLQGCMNVYKTHVDVWYSKSFCQTNFTNSSLSIFDIFLLTNE